MLAQYTSQFNQLIGCETDDLKEGVSLGFTRRGELDDFVDRFMQGWVAQATIGLESGIAATGIVQATRELRFCTYSEFEQLFYPPKSFRYDAPVFTLLEISDEQKRHYYAGLFAHSRDGYFNLMEAVNPPLRAFFFRAHHTAHS